MAEPLSSNPKLQRYHVHGRDDFGYAMPAISVTDTDGDWVKADEAKAAIERLTAERDEAERLADLRLGYKVQRDRLWAAQAEAVRILSAIEFDGQAYEAIQRACKLLTNHGGADTREDSVRQARDTPCDATSSQRYLADPELQQKGSPRDPVLLRCGDCGKLSWVERARLPPKWTTPGTTLGTWVRCAHCDKPLDYRAVA